MILVVKSILMKYVIFAIILDLRRKTSIHPLSQFQMNNFELIQPLRISPSWGGGRWLKYLAKRRR